MSTECSQSPTDSPSSHRTLSVRGRLFSFFRKNTVLCIAALAAAITMFIIPPDQKYAGYFDLRTLSCLFCTLAVICALKNIHFFSVLAHRIVRVAGNTRSAVLVLMVITFVGSMLIANDMALLTFLPLGYHVLSCTGNERYLAFTFIMQDIAANLGGMLTPFGNPQNLYLYSHFAIPDGEFVSIMVLPFILAITLIAVCCMLFVPRTPLQLKKEEASSLPRARTLLYLLLFLLAIAIVFRAIPYGIGLAVIPAVLLFADRRALAAVDYPLLLTFVCFFLFSGNMARIPAVRSFFSELLSHSVLIVSAFSCQLISNVPSAILLSQFTDNYRELLLGVNIGGTGTLIASLASLITFRSYLTCCPGKVRSYLLRFSAFNFSFLFILLLFCWGVVIRL